MNSIDDLSMAKERRHVTRAETGGERPRESRIPELAT